MSQQIVSANKPAKTVDPATEDQWIGAWVLALFVSGLLAMSADHGSDPLRFAVIPAAILMVFFRKVPLTRQSFCIGAGLLLTAFTIGSVSWTIAFESADANIWFTVSLLAVAVELLAIAVAVGAGSRIAAVVLVAEVAFTDYARVHLPGERMLAQEHGMTFLWILVVGGLAIVLAIASLVPWPVSSRDPAWPRTVRGTRRWAWAAFLLAIAVNTYVAFGVNP